MIATTTNKFLCYSCIAPSGHVYAVKFLKHQFDNAIAVIRKWGDNEPSLDIEAAVEQCRMLLGECKVVG